MSEVLVEMKSVVSSNLKAVGYDNEKKELHVEFKGGKAAVYVYKDVPLQLHEELRSSASLGGFFNRFIKGRFSYEMRLIKKDDPGEEVSGKSHKPENG